MRKKMFKLTSKEDLGWYTAHSVRVGACVALHAAGASIMTIQFRHGGRINSKTTYGT